MTSKPVYVLGTGLSHDGSAALLKDGCLVAAIEKERLTRKKHDGGNDTAAIRYLLDMAGISIGDLELIVQNANFGMLRYHNSWLAGERLFHDDLPVVTISHHLAHAYSAFGTSPFEEAAVLVVDGCGSAFDDCMDLGGTVFETPPAEAGHLWNEKDSFYSASGTGISPVAKDFSPWGHGAKNYPMHPPTTRHSIGGIYQAVSYYVFQGMDDAGKLMGLAPYGKPGVHDFPIFDLRDGRVFVNYNWMEGFRRPARSFDEFKARFQELADIAWWVQREVEHALLYLVNARYARNPSPNLCYSGGVALNAVANRRLLTEGPYRNLYIQPAAGDNGIALGCAYYGWFNILKGQRKLHKGSVYLGRSYANDATAKVLQRYQAYVSARRSENVVAEVASALAGGKIVGWFQGGAEFGPRALGHRSILADPRALNVRDYINAKVKFREDFRPFAPSVLWEDRQVYFEGTYPSPHMLLTAPVKPEWRAKIPAVVHQDHSARIQTVTAGDEPQYHALISAFKELTGIGVVLNTSLNRRGMPIVETPEEAVALFMYSGLDLLAIDDFIVSKPPDFDRRMADFNRKYAEESARRTFQEIMAN